MRRTGWEAVRSRSPNCPSGRPASAISSRGRCRGRPPAAVDAAWDEGIRYYDTAPHYGSGSPSAGSARPCATAPATEYTSPPRSGGARPLPPGVRGPRLAEGFAVRPPTGRRLGLQRRRRTPQHRGQPDASVSTGSTSPICTTRTTTPKQAFPRPTRPGAAPRRRRCRRHRRWNEPDRDARPASCARPTSTSCLCAGRYTLLDQRRSLDYCRRPPPAPATSSSAGSSTPGCSPTPGTGPYDYAAAPDPVLDRALRKAVAVTDATAYRCAPPPCAYPRHPPSPRVLSGLRPPDEVATPSRRPAPRPIPDAPVDDLRAEGLLPPTSPSLPAQRGTDARRMRIALHTKVLRRLHRGVRGSAPRSPRGAHHRDSGRRAPPRLDDLAQRHRPLPGSRLRGLRPAPRGAGEAPLRDQVAGRAPAPRCRARLQLVGMLLLVFPSLELDMTGRGTDRRRPPPRTGPGGSPGSGSPGTKWPRWRTSTSRRPGGRGPRTGWGAGHGPRPDRHRARGDSRFARPRRRHHCRGRRRSAAPTSPRPHIANGPGRAARTPPAATGAVATRHQVQGEADPEWLPRLDVRRGLSAVAAAGPRLYHLYAVEYPSAARRSLGRRTAARTHLRTHPRLASRPSPETILGRDLKALADHPEHRPATGLVTRPTCGPGRSTTSARTPAPNS